jgi:hypothetical protein
VKRAGAAAPSRPCTTCARKRSGAATTKANSWARAYWRGRGIPDEWQTAGL